MPTNSNQRNGSPRNMNSDRYSNYDRNQNDDRNRNYGRRSGSRRRGTGKAIIFVVELVVIAALIGALVITVRAFGGSGDTDSVQSEEGTTFFTKLFSTIGDAFGKSEGSGTKGISHIDLKEEELKIAQEVKNNDIMKGYMNVALFGVDISKDKTDENGNIVLLPAGSLRQSGLYKGFRSDTIMIASVNMDTGDIKLVSVYRDTFLNIGETYSKCNAAYAKGGAEQAVKMLNTNLDLDIENFVTVSYWALTGVIDAIGGVDIDVDEKELVHLNNYGISIGKTMNTSYTPLAKPGFQHLNGMQAAAYCRIRYVGNDFARTARQREVLKAIETQAKKSDLGSLLDAFNAVQSDIYTSFSQDDISKLITHLWDYRIAEEDGFPQEEYRTVKNMGAKGSCVVPTDLETNVKWLHKFLFNEEDYNATSNVKENSKAIKNYSSKYSN